MSDNTRRLAGVTALYINGVSYKVADNASWMPQSRKRESMVGLSGWAGYSETFIAGMISATIYDAQELSVTEMNETWTNVQVTIEAANGKIITGTAMVLVESQTVSGKEGTFEVKFEGATVSDQ